MKRFPQVPRTVMATAVPSEAPGNLEKYLGQLVAVSVQSYTPGHMQPGVSYLIPPPGRTTYGAEYVGIIREGTWDLENCVSIPVTSALVRNHAGWQTHEGYPHRSSSASMHTEPSKLAIEQYLGESDSAVVFAGNQAVQHYFALGRGLAMDIARQNPDELLRNEVWSDSYADRNAEGYIAVCERLGKAPEEAAITARFRDDTRVAIDATSMKGLPTKEQLYITLESLEPIALRNPSVRVSTRLTVAEYVAEVTALQEAEKQLSASYKALANKMWPKPE